MRALETKIPPPIVALLFCVLMWLVSLVTPDFGPRGSWSGFAAALIALLGISISAAGVVTFRRAKTTTDPLKPATASSLVVTGIYQYSRNPMYLGVSIILLAWAVYLRSPVALLGVAGFVLYIDRLQIAPEERALESLFGDAFVAYKARVRRWL